MKQDISPTPHWIDDQQELLKLIGELKSHNRLALDTESNSLYAYQEQVCLIQISTPDSDYLLDPLNLPDLSPLNELMSDSAIEKVFHGAEYDVICLKRDFSFRIQNLFDTRVALRTLGRERTGLGDVLEGEFGVKINNSPDKAKRLSNLEGQLLQLEIQRRDEQIAFWKDTVELREKLFEGAATYKDANHRYSIFSDVEEKYGR